MATKIFYNDNRIIIDGHADTAEECRAITAMCDSMANSENFKTIVYEQGHAVFEQISGERAMFLAGLITEEQIEKLIEKRIDSLLTQLKGIYLEQDDAVSIYATKISLNDVRNELLTMIGSFDPYTSQGTLAQQLSTLNTTVTNLQAEAEQSFGAYFDWLNKLENKASKPLPYTADELIAKLESI